MNKIKKHFTILEVIIAVAILAMGVVTFLSFSTQSTRRTIKSHKNWKIQHATRQAMEYFLLTGETSIPEFIMDDENISFNCSFSQPVLKDGIESKIKNNKLISFDLDVFYEDKLVNSLKVNKVVPEDFK